MAGTGPAGVPEPTAAQRARIIALLDANPHTPLKTLAEQLWGEFQFAGAMPRGWVLRVAQVLLAQEIANTAQAGISISLDIQSNGESDA